MTLAAMDALGAFSHLQSNLPTWITRVSDLATHTSAKYAEYTEAYRRHASHKPRRRKSSSACSIHTSDLIPIAQQKGPVSEAIEVSTTNTKDAPVSTQCVGRKRSADEASSLDPSDRYEFVSTRHNVIIDYDGHTQKVLEEVVRDIGFARNHIRRGRIAMMPRNGLRSGFFNKTVNIGTNNTANGESPLAALACVRSTRTGADVVGVSESTNLLKGSPFEFADKQLELAYGLCETAAYQVLRSGDCATELDGVEEKFKMLLEVATSEVKRLEEEKSMQQDKAPAPSEEPPLKTPPTPAAMRLARMQELPNSKFSSDTTHTPGTIEVDDASSISAESIDLSAFRASRIRV